MLTSYASGRNRLPFTSANISVSSDGNLPAQTIYFAIQGKNLAGYNLPSNLVVVNIPSNGKVTIAIPGLNSGEYYKEIILSASTINNENSLVQIASVSVASSQSLVVLENLKDLELSKIVATSNNLPVNPLRGAIRYVNELTKYFQYLPDSIKLVDNINVLPGKWVRIGSFSTTITNFSGQGGANQSVSEVVAETIDAPSYSADGSKGEGIVYFLSNTTTSTLNAGTSVKVSVFVNGENKSTAFDSLLVLEVLGYSNLTTGELDNSIASGEVLFKPNENNLTLTKALNPGNAVALKISPKFTVANVSTIITSNSSVLSVLPYLVIGNTSTYVAGSSIVGDSIHSSSDKMAIVPWTGLSVKKLAGSGTVGGYEISNTPEEIIGGLQSNTLNQYILLASNGSSFSSTTTVEGTVIRAVVGTKEGIGFPSNWSHNIYLSSTNQLVISITYPTSIREDYPDLLIKNNSKGKFNALGVRIYLQAFSNQTIYYTDKLVIPNEQLDTYTLSFSDFVSYNNNEIEIPDNNYFGLFASVIQSIYSINSIGNYPQDSYRVAIAFKYEDTVTSINHSTSLGAIITSTGPLLESFENHIQDFQNPHQVSAEQVGKDLAQWNASFLQDSPVASIAPEQNSLLTWDENIWTPIAALKMLKLQAIGYPPDTNANEGVLFLDATDLKFKVRYPNNGAILTLGAGNSSENSDISNNSNINNNSLLQN